MYSSIEKATSYIADPISSRHVLPPVTLGKITFSAIGIEFIFGTSKLKKYLSVCGNDWLSVYSSVHSVQYYDVNMEVEDKWQWN